MGMALPWFTGRGKLALLTFKIFLLPLSMKKIDKLQPSELFLLYNKQAFLLQTGVGVRAEHLS